jgi:predicted dehydrogenase
MNSFNWAIVGPGRIAHRFAEAVTKLDGTRITCVQGRDHARAEAFAREWRREEKNNPQSIRVTTSLNDVLQLNDVDAVYIASPHPFHADAIRACLQAKKPVLCEKPMVTDAATARELAALSHAQNTFLMEAMWTRFLPIYATVREWIASGKIGRVRAMQSSFCFNVHEHGAIDPHSRLFNPALAGGTLLDIGIYNLSVTRWVMWCAFGAAPTLRRMDVLAKIGPTGVDHEIAASLQLENDVTSQFVTSFESSAENAFHVFGEYGSITIHPFFWEATRATLSKGRDVLEHVEKPFSINGFEYEVMEAIRCVHDSRVESDVISHAETIATLEWMDAMRAKMGVRYPFDRG